MGTLVHGEFSEKSTVTHSGFAGSIFMHLTGGSPDVEDPPVLMRIRIRITISCRILGEYGHEPL